MKYEDYHKDANGVKKFKTNFSGNSDDNKNKSIIVLFLGIFSLFTEMIVSLSAGMIVSMITLLLGRKLKTKTAKIGVVCASITVVTSIIFLAIILIYQK